MTRAWHLVLIPCAALSLAAEPAAAQIGFGGHVVRVGDDLRGAGARITAGLPLIPIHLAANGEVIESPCEDCSRYAASIDANWSLPLPLIEPWVGVGWSIRIERIGPTERTERGPNVGVGAALRLASVQPFVDLRYEFGETLDSHTRLRIGLVFR